MRLLLDTHVLLWWLVDAPELSERARNLLSAPENLVFISAASVWEVRIKQALGKIELPKNFAEALEEESFEKLGVTVEHAHAISELPLHHRDPFDRILVAQARCDRLTLVTHDEILKKYDVQVEHV